MTTRRVALEGGAPWGFRMHGGTDQNQPLRVIRVNQGSKAAKGGIREGDLISSINGNQTKDLTNAEAHNLLRNTEDKLVLELNEDIESTPRRRKYKTVRQETHEETIKKSSVTTYSIKKNETIEASTAEIPFDTQQKDNHNELPKKNGILKTSTPKHGVDPERFYLSSSTSSTSSTSTLKDSDQKNLTFDNAEASWRSSCTNCTLSPSSSFLSEDGNSNRENMNSSKSKKRRQRKKTLKMNSNNNKNPISIIVCDNLDVRNSTNIETDQYVVMSPVENLDNEKSDETVNIQEVSGNNSEIEDNGNQAIVSEACSDGECNESNLSTTTLPLEDCNQINMISSNEENDLRNFLKGLNLVSSPEDAAKYVNEKSNYENVKERKARKKAELEQYFSPYGLNPRYLDVIFEENSDKHSDKDLPIANNFNNETILVHSKVVDNTSISEGICTVIQAEKASNAEVVFLNEFSDSPEEGEKTSLDSYSTDVESESKTKNIEDDKLSDNVNECDNEISPAKTHSPPPSVSPLSSCSSSRSSSLCTARYIPSNSSFTDAIALSKEDDELFTKSQDYFQPLTLREICLIFLISHPFGKEILQELANVSKYIEYFTDSLPSAVLPKLIPNIAKFTNKSQTDNNISSISSSVLDMPKQVVDDKIDDITMKEDDKQFDEKESNPSVLDKIIKEFKNNLNNENSVDIDRLSKSENVTDINESIKNDERDIKKEIFIPILKEWKEESFLPNANKEIIIPVVIEEEKVVSPDFKHDSCKIVNIPISKEWNENSKNQSVNTLSKLLHLTDIAHFPIDDCKVTKQEWRECTESTNKKIISIDETKWKGNIFENLEQRFHDLPLNQKNIEPQQHEQDNNKETIITINKSIVDASPSNRLLTIFEENGLDDNKMKNSIFFTEKDPKPKTLSRSISTDNPRLKAKNLDEWLHLARNKSKSESNLSIASDIPENNLLTYQSMNFYQEYMAKIKEEEEVVQNQIKALEEEKMKLNAENKKRPMSMPAMPTEFFRQKMYKEYLDKFAEREDRKQHNVIKVTSVKDEEKVESKEIIHPIQLQDEFMDMVKKKQQEGVLEKINISEEDNNIVIDQSKSQDKPVLVMDGDKVEEAKKLPKHIQEFVNTTRQAEIVNGVWSPGQHQETNFKREEQRREIQHQNEPIPPVWTPKSANSSPVLEKKEFKSVSFQSPLTSRKDTIKNSNSDSFTIIPPWKAPDYSSDSGIGHKFSENRLTNSQTFPSSYFFGDRSFSASRLPKAQNPTITLLQKAREGQLGKGPTYIDQEIKTSKITKPEVRFQIDKGYSSEIDLPKQRKMTDMEPRKLKKIGPVTRDGMPLLLRSEIKDQNQSKWYKRMYDTIHKTKPHNDEYVTIRYRQKRAQYPYTSGYLSDPEPGSYDSDFTEYKYQTLDRRRPIQTSNTSTVPRSLTTRTDVPKDTREYYKMPGKIENYTPGHSSISEKEAKQWWDEVMDIFDGNFEKQLPPSTFQPKGLINQALKESGYESDSTLVFRKKEDATSQLSPKDQKEAYKIIQKGGDVPLHGLRKPAPERPKEPDPAPPVPPPKGTHARNLDSESPRKYVENEVTIHYKTPIRQEIKEYLSEDELAYRQAEAMKKIYQEERRKKYLQELHDMNSRRHADNFISSQKSPISLNRYDDFDVLAPAARPRPRSPEPRLVARALYNFIGQTARELTFRKGDLIYVRRQVDRNWYEGELNAMVGLFPTNYVEIVPYDGTKQTPRKSHEGQARAKYNFLAQTHLELSLAKGELVVITRRIDNNWFEGKIGGRKGIFPASYVEVLIDPQEPAPAQTAKPVAAPAAHSLLLNGSAGGKESMGSHSYTPNFPTQVTTSYQPTKGSSNTSSSSVQKKTPPPVDQALFIETHNEPVSYRALYKYTPQNDDELELLEGDTVYVLEKCDDGWYVGSSGRTGAFGTFPGNYVEKI